ncbi:uncharacterized protein B0I36DRAFT_21938 [Microdochium trichocladiopsis]|uniref:Imitation switch two complex protein 1 n=1 Tax=Microdochium trichocladiopsis TaxID=1682393 RepID=A0A9P9BX03_9PEZI|nr:uncharacterized protein B0I36DRAFT_21938 [Microdochium trichocladiopsis]KAH7041322.1 hypothetical protein B0I36DRAFT_21938 [Microdochium trichocladiopsis]
MVLFKRKPVRFLQPPQVEDEEQDVWHIPQTGEIFVNYEDYLHRMDFYNQPRFICEITGHSGQSFFDALKSELTGAQEVDQAFPEALKGPVLRRVQFQTISRIDALVDTIYDEFRHDYYPGEAVTIELVSGKRCTGIVRDKSRMGSKVLPDGTITQPYSRYFTSIDGKPGEEAVVDDLHIYRERKVFTKQVLRSFIKKTVTREAWTGAPWLVKHDVAAKYHIDTRVPPHLRYDNKLLERKQHQLQKKGMQPANGQINGMHDVSAVGGPFHNFGPARLPELKPAPKSHKAGKAHQHYQAPAGPHVIGGPSLLNDDDQSPVPTGSNPFQFPGSFRQNIPPPVPTPVYRQPTPPPPPPLPKYPIEDLQLEPRDDYVRPALKFLCSDPPEGVVDNGERNDKILMKSMGPLLETWDTLNVYCEIFKLDSFTFDDFVQGMEIAKPETPCQLFDEIHCAVLKQLVTAEKDGAELQVDLPELEDEEDDEDDEEEEEEVEPSPEPEPKPKPAARATRSSLAKQEAERLQAEIAASFEKEETPEPTIKHRAVDALAEFDWVEQLSKRNFQDGGWELIMVGLLYQLSKDDRHAEACEHLLEQLVPADVDPTQETVRQHYGELNLNDRVSALQMICMLTSGTKAMRNYMEECAETMTGYRKERIEWQRNKKQAMEELKALNEEHKALLPDNLPPSPPAEEEESKTNGDVSMADADTTLDEPSEEGDSDDASAARRKRRRGGDRAAERQRKREELERKREAELAAKVPKQSKQFLKVLKDIQKKEEFIKKCEEEVAVLENDLREADCGRTRVLGKDRFWNRYYWFERNGMPYAGLPNSSTAHAGYASGCIWVQGPDDMEREGYIDLLPEYQAEYKAKFKMTVPQRKKMEEGRTSVYNAWQWGYFSEPDEVDSLLNWLDPRGYNELKLRKEILAFKDKIVDGMKNRLKYLGIEKQREEAAAAAAAAEAEAQAAKKAQEEEEQRKAEAAAAAAAARQKEEEATATRSSRRMATRGKNQNQPAVQVSAPAASSTSSAKAEQSSSKKKEEPETFRCQDWTNTMAIDELGHIHSEPPAVKPSRKAARKSKG